MTWFTRLRDWTTDQANGIGIRADYHDQEDDNFASGVNQSLNIAGLNSPTANIPMGTFKFTGMGNGSAAADSATLGQVQTRVVAYAADSVGTDDYAITLSPALAAYAVGQSFYFAAGTANTGAATLNINGLGAKTIKKDYNVDLADGDIPQNKIVHVIYDGTNFQLLSPPQGLMNQSMSPIYAADGGGSDSYSITLSPALSSYATGQLINFKANTKNTGGASLNVNGLGAKAIKKDQGADLADGDIAASQIVQVIYDGTNFQMLSPIFGCNGQNGASVYAADAGVNDDYVITLSPAPTAYVTGMMIRAKCNTANTGAATINVNSLGVKSIVKGAATALSTGDIQAGQIVTLIYDGTNFQLANYIANGTVTSVATGNGLTGGIITTTGTLSLAPGVPYKVRSATKTDTQTNATATPADITGLSITLTPLSASSTFLIISHINGSSNAGTAAPINLIRDSTQIGLGDAAGSRRQVSAAMPLSFDANDMNCVSFAFLDSPATGSSITYKLQCYHDAGTIAINRSSTDTDSNDYPRGISTITVIEMV